ncbi:MAG: hypothetical protein HY395_01465 [Candidatus Doudnabacteria bacterium]|nr:hypothetical protein [Candidatus Doudnabacteria bacterium]
MLEKLSSNLVVVNVLDQRSFQAPDLDAPAFHPPRKSFWTPLSRASHLSESNVSAAAHSSSLCYPDAAASTLRVGAGRDYFLPLAKIKKPTGMVGVTLVPKANKLTNHPETAAAANLIYLGFMQLHLINSITWQINCQLVKSSHTPVYGRK